MKLKPLVASMLLVGVVNFAFAADLNEQDLNALKAKVSKLEAVLDQNQGQTYAFSQLPFKDGWEKYVTLSGSINAEFSNNTVFEGNAAAADPREFAVPVTDQTNPDRILGATTATLFIDAKPNCWVNVHVAADFNGNVDRAFSDASNWAFHNGASSFTFSEAYATIANFQYSPVYARAGVQNVPFGVYDPYAVTASLTQAMSQNKQAALLLGAVTNFGLDASVYAYNGSAVYDRNEVAAMQYFNPSRDLRDGGIHLGYNGSFNGLDYNVVADYETNMYDNDFLYRSKADAAAVDYAYSTRLQAVSAHLGLNYLKYDVSADYVKAVRGADAQDFSYGGDADANGVHQAALPGAWAAGAGYAFDVYGLPSHFGVSYQQTHKAVAFELPKSRWLGEYKVTIGRATDLALQVYHDTAYLITDEGSVSTNTRTAVAAPAEKVGSGTNDTSVLLNLGIKFA